MDFNTFAVYIARAIAILIAIPFHEAAHAYVSFKLGDPTAKNYGRLSLNPLKHFDPLGALCMILVGFGWAKPVPVSAMQRFKNPKRDMAISAAAGPVSNILLAFIFMVIYKIFVYSLAIPASYELSEQTQMIYIFINIVLSTMVSINIMLAAFNLLPVPPLDGSRIAYAFLPQRTYFNIMRYERYIMIALFAFLYLGILNGPISFLQNIIWDFLYAITGFVDAIFNLIYQAAVLS